MTTQVGLRLTDLHRTAQQRIAAQTAAVMLQLYPLMRNPAAIPGNTATWLDLVVAYLAAQRAKSAGLAAEYYTAYRAVELGPGVPAIQVVPQAALPVEAVKTSMSVLGPVAYKREAARQLNLDPREMTEQMLADTQLPANLQQTIAANAARAAQRHVRNGARETVDTAYAQDPRTIGYVRTERATCCPFCLMLVSRGPVYDDDSFEASDPRFSGPGDQKVHDGCGGDIRPLYDRNDASDFNKASREANALWAETGNYNDFRKAAVERGLARG